MVVGETVPFPSELASFLIWSMTPLPPSSPLLLEFSSEVCCFFFFLWKRRPSASAAMMQHASVTRPATDSRLELAGATIGREDCKREWNTHALTHTHTHTRTHAQTKSNVLLTRCSSDGTHIHIHAHTHMNTTIGRLPKALCVFGKRALFLLASFAKDVYQFSDPNRCHTTEILFLTNAPCNFCFAKERCHLRPCPGNGGAIFATDFCRVIDIVYRGGLHFMVFTCEFVFVCVGNVVFTPTHCRHCPTFFRFHASAHTLTHVRLTHAHTHAYTRTRTEQHAWNAWTHIHARTFGETNTFKHTHTHTHTHSEVPVSSISSCERADSMSSREGTLEKARTIVSNSRRADGQNPNNRRQEACMYNLLQHDALQQSYKHALVLNVCQ